MVEVDAAAYASTDLAGRRLTWLGRFSSLALWLVDALGSDEMVTRRQLILFDSTPLSFLSRTHSKLLHNNASDSIAFIKDQTRIYYIVDTFAH